MNTEKVTRIEVVDHEITNKGRVYTVRDDNIKGKVGISLQDEGRTLKVFISEGISEGLSNQHSDEAYRLGVMETKQQIRDMVSKYMEQTRKDTGAFKYDACYEEILEDPLIAKSE